MKKIVSKIAYYISSHGYGHAARQQAIINRLAQSPHIEIYVRTAAPAKFFKGATDVHTQHYDIGMIQRDALTMDIAASLQWMADFLVNDEAQLIRDEVVFCQQTGIDLVVSDMPPLACEVAQYAGVPSVVMTHFTWDWVYDHYMDDFPQYRYIIDHLQAQYGKATLAMQMQLPYPHDFDMFPVVEPTGLIYNMATRNRQQIRQLFDVPDGMPMVLLSMGGHRWAAQNVEALIALDEVIYLVMPDVWEQVKNRGQHFRAVPMAFDSYHDLIAAADVVVGKAGGSTVAEVLGHQTPMIYTTQHITDWHETALLSRTLADHASSLYIPLEDFLAGAWVAQLPDFLAREHQWTTIERDGAADAARRLLAFLK